MERSLGVKVTEGLIRVVCGPKVEGVVKMVMRDPHDLSYWHLLLETEQGEYRHLIERDKFFGYNSENGWGIQSMPWEREDQLSANVRGTGVILMPWSKVLRDPFRLKSHKSIV